MVSGVFDDWYSVPFVKKQSKDSQAAKNNHWCTNRHMSTQSPPNTQSRGNAATLRDLHHMCLGSGHSPSPVGRADSMCLHGRLCVWFPFSAACCYTLFYLVMMPAARLVCQRPSSNFIDIIMKAILFVILNVSVCFPRGSVGVEILIPGRGVGGLNERNFPGSLSLAMTPPATHL